MIASLSGRLKVREPGRVVVETGGVGYEVFIPLSTYWRLPERGAAVELAVRQVVREDALQLYGFWSVTDRNAFDLLVQVQHVGPKLALAVVSVLTPEELAAAIAREDVARIDAVPGVGAKMAERVVRELRDRVAELGLGQAPQADGGGLGARGVAEPTIDDAVSALVNLGYKPAEAKRAVDAAWARAGGSRGGLEAVIRDSLQILLGER